MPSYEREIADVVAIEYKIMKAKQEVEHLRGSLQAKLIVDIYNMAKGGEVDLAKYIAGDKAAKLSEGRKLVPLIGFKFVVSDGRERRVTPECMAENRLDSDDVIRTKRTTRANAFVVLMKSARIAWYILDNDLSIEMANELPNLRIVGKDIASKLGLR